MSTTLDQAANTALDRLGDLDCKLWTQAEAKLYVQDGYDLFCEQTKCLFDVVVIENVPSAGNWQTDLERYLAEQRPGWGLTDDRIQYTGNERNFGVGGRVGGPWEGPTSMTRPSDAKFSPDGTITACRGGSLPQSVVSIVRVAWDDQDIYGITESELNDIDPYWEGRTGDPRWFVYDSEGLYKLRIVPMADGGAQYDLVKGTWGVLRYRTSGGATLTITLAGATAGDYVYIGDSSHKYTFADSYDSGSTDFAQVQASATGSVAASYLCSAVNGGGWASEANPYFTATVDDTVVTLTQRTGWIDYTHDGPVAVESMDFTSSSADIVVSDVTLPDPDATLVLGGRGGFGILRDRSGMHPSGGPWGLVRRIHPSENNVQVEVFRLGGNLSGHVFELPQAYVKYVVYYAMSQLLRKEGPGQNIDLADHYMQRFDMGVARMKHRDNRMMPEYAGSFGPAVRETAWGGLGDPQPSTNDMEAPS